MTAPTQDRREWKWDGSVDGYAATTTYAHGDGPWNDEPDKAQWIDEATGLDCLIVRGPSGALCGYVGVPPEHPWHGLDYGQHFDVPCADRESDSYCYGHGHRPDELVKVHGGLTFASSCAENAPEGYGICHVLAPGRPADVWWFGFDCAHAWDVSPKYDHHFVDDETYRTVDYVEGECANLARQLAAVSR